MVYSCCAMLCWNGNSFLNQHMHTCESQFVSVLGRICHISPCRRRDPLARNLADCLTRGATVFPAAEAHRPPILPLQKLSIANASNSLWKEQGGLRIATCAAN